MLYSRNPLGRKPGVARLNKVYLQSYVKQLQPSCWGKIFYYLLPFRKRVVLSNMTRVFDKVLSPQEITKLAQSFYSHVARSLRENLMLRFMSMTRIGQAAQLLGKDKILTAAKANKGVLILTGHFGNWEFAPIAAMANFEIYRNRFHFVRRTLRNKFFEKILFRRYYQAGLKVIPKKNSLPQVCAALEQQDAVVFVMDQHAGIAQKDGIVAEFFGHKAGTYRSLATIAQYMQVPVVPAMSYRRADGKHVLQFFDQLPWIKADDHKQEIYLNTLAYNQALEKMILIYPEQWLWMHKRWKI